MNFRRSHTYARLCSAYHISCPGYRAPGCNMLAALEFAAEIELKIYSKLLLHAGLYATCYTVFFSSILGFISSLRIFVTLYIVKRRNIQNKRLNRDEHVQAHLIVVKDVKNSACITAYSNHSFLIIKYCWRILCRPGGNYCNVPNVCYYNIIFNRNVQNESL